MTIIEYVKLNLEFLIWIRMMILFIILISCFAKNRLLMIFNKKHIFIYFSIILMKITYQFIEIN